MYQRQFQAAFEAINSASKIVMEGYSNGVEISTKEDASLVTSADKEADKIIREILHNYFPEYGFLTEESVDDLSRISKEFVWIVDPIDGTKEFINHEYEFVINIALARNGEVVLGLVKNPLTEEIFYAIKGEGSYVIKDDVTRKIKVSDNVDKLTCLTSPYHQSVEEKLYLNKHQDKFAKIIFGGAGYKACLIASGKADVSYRLSPSSKEWDIAPIDLIVREAGGYFFDKNRKPFTYNKKDVRNLDGFVMVNRLENYF